MLNYDFPLFVTMRQSGGFTLIELMIVIAIVATLVALAVSVYQMYTISWRCSYGVTALSELRYLPSTCGGS